MPSPVPKLLQPNQQWLQMINHKVYLSVSAINLQNKYAWIWLQSKVMQLDYAINISDNQLQQFSHILTLLGSCLPQVSEHIQNTSQIFQTNLWAV